MVDVPPRLEAPRRAVVERLRVLVLRAVVPAGDLRPAAAGFDAFARVEADFFAAVERLAVEARFVDEREVDVFARDPVARLAVEPLDPVEPSSSVHLPERTRCAASATASAISDPSLDALETIARLIAAFASLSSVSLPDEPLLLLDLAIANLPFGLAPKTLQLPYGSVSAMNRACNSAAFDCPNTLKGTVAEATIPSNMVSGRK